ncbi:uncharacterized protein LOC111278849 isoform X2 [Durio zibethinus]|uniref:Uncharacterized protein LOC111278849 isoform X2 n=1 Tax=Durio zibethinus TaxID=66656 RepID=A0A6P5WYR7_DURZI|nr:uncharacterized protein LOC111278849 isoform X2 [Durio zibethinus]
MLTNEQREAIVDYFLGYKLLLLSFRGGGRRISDLPCQDEINVVRWEQLKYIQPSGKRKVVFVFRLTQTIVMNLIQLQCQPYPTFGRTKRGIRQDSESEWDRTSLGSYFVDQSFLIHIFAERISFVIPYTRIQKIPDPRLHKKIVDKTPKWHFLLTQFFFFPYRSGKTRKFQGSKHSLEFLLDSNP